MNATLLHLLFLILSAHLTNHIYECVPLSRLRLQIDDCAKDGGEEYFTKMYCVRIANP